MAQQSLFRALETYWYNLPQLYRTPLAIASCSALLITPYVWKKLTYQPELLPPPPKDFRYRLYQTGTSSTLTLPTGRKIGYAQYGDKNGRAIIVLHGILGSRIESALFHDMALELGARIIAIERPGIGLSTPDLHSLPERKVITHAQDVEAVVEHLKLSEYAVLGTSGGGPYALACARALPSSPSKPKLKAVAVVTGLGLSDMSQPWPAWVVYLNRTFNLRWILRRVFISGPIWNLRLTDEERMEAMRKSFDIKTTHPADVETARRPEYPDWQRIFLRSSREAISQGYDGFLDDAATLAKDPGFRVGDIRSDLPVQLWYGTDDTNISPKAGVETAERLRSAGNTKVELHMLEGETHGSTQVKYRERTLEDLLRAMG